MDPGTYIDIYMNDLTSSAKYNWSIRAQLNKFKNSFEREGLKRLRKVMVDCLLNDGVIKNPIDEHVDWMTYGLCHCSQTPDNDYYYHLDEVRRSCTCKDA